jgi:hypothetical protein
MNTPIDETQTVANDQKPSTNGNGTPAAAAPQNTAPGPDNAEHTAPAVMGKFQFDKPEYAGTAVAEVTVLRTGELTGEARVNVLAKKSTDLNGDYLMQKELLFKDQQAEQQIVIPVGPNTSPTATTVTLELINPSSAELGAPRRAVVVVQPSTWGGLLRSLVGRFFGFFRNPEANRVLKHALLAAFLIGCVFAGNRLVRIYADTQSKDWHDHLAPTNEPELKFNLDASEVYWIPKQMQQRLTDQLVQIRHKKAYHLALMEFFYKGYYMGIVILSFTAALAAITLLLISKKGWADTSQYIITTFFIMTCASLFYGSWAGLFKQEDNITENKVLFLKYVSLENELFSYVTTGESLNYRVTTEDLSARANPAPTPTPAPSPAASAAQAKGKTAGKEEPHQPTTEPDVGMSLGINRNTHDFIHYIDLQLAQDNIAIGFDYSQVPNYKNAFSTLTK